MSPSRITARAPERCGITHHLGCACHEARRDAELVAAREALARVTAERDAVVAAARESLAADTARDDAGETAYRAANAHNPGSDAREAAERAHSEANVRAARAHFESGYPDDGDIEYAEDRLTKARGALYRAASI